MPFEGSLRPAHRLDEKKTTRAHRSQFVRRYCLPFFYFYFPETCKETQAHKSDLNRIRVDRFRKKQKIQLGVIVNEDARRVLTVQESIHLHLPRNFPDLPLNPPESSPLDGPIIPETTESAPGDDELAALCA